MTTKEKMSRRFSEELKRELVEKIASGKLRVCEVVKIYEVSKTAVNGWKSQYGKEIPLVRTVVEKSSIEYQLKALQKELNDRNAAIGELHMQIRYKDQMIASINKELGYDIEKKS